MKKHGMQSIILCLSMTGMCLSVLAGQIRDAHFPAPSPDGTKLLFSYQGDLWVTSAAGGRAERLTVHTGYESTGRWSPDGAWIAFESDRFGNDDIFVMPSDGSAPPTRLTYYSMHDALYSWTPDGTSVLFGSYRHTYSSTLYEIPMQGGMPRMVLDFSARELCMLPDGKTILFSRNGASWWRRRYQGGNDKDIWMKVLPDGTSQRLTDTPGHDGYPMYSVYDGKVYFVSNRSDDRVKNLWRMNIDGTAPEQLTHETEDIYFPCISGNGRIIAYECDGCLAVFDVATLAGQRIMVEGGQDYKENPETYQVFMSQATEFRLSPDEEQLAFVVHGDIFVMSFKEGRPDKVVQVTSTPYIERDISWHPSRELIIYSSMQDGDMDICTIEPAEKERFAQDLLFITHKVVNTPETESKPVFSPNGEYIAYFKNQRELFVMDKDGRNHRQLYAENDVLWMDWSPDSRWITFSRTALGWREDIYVVPVNDPGKAVNISIHPNDDYKPMWSADGKRISFASRNATGDLWVKYVFLQKADEERDPEYWETYEPDSNAQDVVIEFEDIEDRIHTVVKVQGYYNIIDQSPDGEQYVLYSNNLESNDIWTVDWQGKDLKRITENNARPKQFTVSRNRKDIYYLSGTGALYKAAVASAASVPLNFTVGMYIDHYTEQEQVFREAWWALQDGFYDSDFHGVDWRAMYDKYYERALASRTTRDFQMIVGMMIGELNASHLGVWKQGPEQETTGALGIVFNGAYHGKGARVERIIPDSPASEEKAGIDPGDIITHIDGVAIEPGDNVYAYLRNKNNKEIMLTIDEPGGTRNVRITAKDPWAIARFVDRAWERSNEEYVHEKSKGRVGYVYIASMGVSNLRQFEQDLYHELDREGLILDIRYNGGGSIHDELIEILRRTVYAYSIERDGTREYNSLFRWDKPIVLLINEYCYSDAEIFPAAFKELKLGTVVGQPTFGAVIGTNDIQLLDGTGFRVPGTGWYTLSGTNLENTPVTPDIFVENAPEQDGLTGDNQLKRAIEIMLEQLRPGR
jgi:tricorn protease